MRVKAGIAVHATQGDDAKKVENPTLPNSSFARAHEIHTFALGAHITGSHCFLLQPSFPVIDARWRQQSLSAISNCKGLC